MMFALQSRRVVTPEGTRPAAVLVDGERIAAVLPHGSIPASVRVDDVGERVVLPGLVDTHVHVCEPGRIAWEGFETATQAAAVGGITTVIDMPDYSSPVTATPEALRGKIAVSEGKRWVDVGFYAGVVPGHTDALEAVLRAGALGAKASMSAVGDGELPAISEADLRAALPVLARAGKPLLVHAELETVMPPPRGDPRVYRSWLASRPATWEVDAIDRLLRLCREYRARVHIVHLSAAAAIPMLIRAKVEGLPVTVETCPHYLFFHAEDIPDGDTRFKCAPPIRERLNSEHLWGALLQGTIDMVVSDHSPCPPAQKTPGDFFRAWSGISSLQWSLFIVWTAGREVGITFDQIARWMSAAPARLVGIYGRKGCIAAGADADLVVWEPDATFEVREESTYHRHKLSPYVGRRLFGVVESVYLRGRLVARCGMPLAGARGAVLLGDSS